MRSAITYGTFDLLHVGHINLLKRLKEIADYLVVGVSTDEFNLSKGKRSFYSFDERRQLVESIKFVDQVIPEKNWAQKEDDIKKYSIDIFAMGDDWQGKFDFLSKHCQVIYLPRTAGVCSTDAREWLAKKNGDTVINELEAAMFGKK